MRFGVEVSHCAREAEYPTLSFVATFLYITDCCLRCLHSCAAPSADTETNIPRPGS